ncbi:MAG: hypothetical protein MJE77_32385 [Proteobacteria bacterium]|nr:hypothetical protein [Pseudomonadota bacterium]
MASRPKFFAGWMLLCAIIVGLLTVAMTVLFPALGAVAPLWLLVITYVPGLLAGGIIGYAAPDNRAIEAACGFILTSLILTTIAMVRLLVAGAKPPDLLWLPLAIIQSSIGGLITYGGAVLVRVIKNRTPPGWQGG